MDNTSSFSRYIENIKSKVSDNELVIMLIGRTGNGKSRTGCNILGDQNAFPIGHFESETSSPSKKSTIIEGLKVTVIDTPGLFDSRGIDTDINQARAVLEFLTQTKQGVDVVLLFDVFDQARFDSTQQSLVKNFSTIFSNKGNSHLWQWAGGLLTKGNNPISLDFNTFRGRRETVFQDNVMQHAPTNIRLPIAVFENVNPSATLPNGKTSYEELYSCIWNIVKTNNGKKLKIELPKETWEKIEQVMQNSSGKFDKKEVMQIMAPIVVEVIKYLFLGGSCNII